MTTLDNIIVVFGSMLALTVVAILSAKYLAPFLRKMNKLILNKLTGRTEDTNDRKH